MACFAEFASTVKVIFNSAVGLNFLPPTGDTFQVILKGEPLSVRPTSLLPINFVRREN